MRTLLYVPILFSSAQFIFTSQALGLEALTPCVLTASDGAVVQAYCEETITPCVLTASNGAIVQAYCEPSLVGQPFAGITGISALENATATTSIFQILQTSANTISFNGKPNSTSSLLPASGNNPPVLSADPSTTVGISPISPLASPIQATTNTPATTRTLSAQAYHTTAPLANTAVAAGPYCTPNAEPDFGGGTFCTCLDGNTYAIETTGTTPASLYNPCPYTSGSTPQTTAAPDISNCEFDGPANCSTTTDLNIQSIINQAQAVYVQEEISNCSTFTARAGYPGVNGAANGDSCIEYFNITSHMIWWWGENADQCTNVLNVGFANCFYDLVWDGNSNCSNLAANFYCAEPTIDHFSGVNQTLDFYVAWNIYNYATWSWTYYTAVQYAYDYTTAMIWNDTLAFEQIKGSFPLGMEIMIGVLTFALGILSPSGWGKTLPGDGGAKAVNAAIEGAGAESAQATALSAWILAKIFQPEVPGEYLLRAVQQAPGLIHTILVPAETGTINDAIITSAGLTAQLRDFALALSQIIESVAVAVPDNVTAFAEWTSGGYYFVELPMTVNDMVNYITWGLNTYVISQILQNDNVFITRQLDTNPYDLQHNSSANTLTKASIIGCDSNYNEWNQCGPFWWDEINNVAYSLSSTSDISNNYASDLTAVFNNNLTTPELLFLGSQACQDGYNATADASPFQNAAGGLVGQNTACLSNMAVCTWNLANGSYEFVEAWCNNDGYQTTGWDFDDCAADMVEVPVGYLGYYLWNGATCESDG